MDEQPVSHDYVTTVRQGRAKMSNRSLNEYRIHAHAVARRAKAQVFNTQDGRDENGVARHFEQPLRSRYSTTLDLPVPPSDYPRYPIEFTALSKWFTTPGNDRLMNALQVTANLGVPERCLRHHTTRRSPRNCRLKLGFLIRYRWADLKISFGRTGYTICQLSCLAFENSMSNRCSPSSKRPIALSVTPRQLWSRLT